MTNDVAIKVEGVSKTFKLPHEKNASIKGALINFRKGKKGYEKQQVLNDVSFEIKKGEFFGIVGRNGSGKSTLLKLLAGIYAPDNGNIDVEGKLTPFIELGVGFNPELSGRENVFLNGALLGFNRKEMEKMYDEIVDFAELERFMDQKLKNYSSGMQVRLAFSIAVQANTEILLLDEVLAVGDAAFQQKCYDYFERLKREKKTIIIVTHDMSAVKRFCTRAAYVVNGKMVKIGNPLEIADLYTEANIEGVNVKDDKFINPSSYDLEARINKQTINEVIIGFSYKAKNRVDTYIGISVIRDGISIADITTSLEKPLVSSGKLTFTLNTDILNEGVYQISASLFKKNNRECVAVSRHKNIFTLKGEDITRGNALKLPDTWNYR